MGHQPEVGKTQPEMPLATFSLAFPFTWPGISNIRLPNGLKKQVLWGWEWDHEHSY